MKTMRILYVTTAYPPFFDMQTIRNIKLINRLVENGNQVTVLSPDAQWLVNKNQSSKIQQAVEEWRTTAPPLIRIQRFLGSKFFLKQVLKVFNVVVNYLPIPDMFSGWSLVSRRIINQNFKSNDFDLVVTSSGGYSAHFVGNYINKKYGTKWVADYGDPWGLNIYGKRKSLPYIIENKLLKRCSALFFTTENTINAYKKNFRLSTIPVYCLPCGYDDYSSIGGYKDNQNKVFKIVYTGVAYSLSRNLSNAVIAVSKFDNFNFEIVGSYSQKFVDLSKTLNADNVYFRGKVPYDESIEIIQKADILLHIGNFGTLQIPGKTYIYLGTPKPIIYIKQEELDDPTLNLLSEFEGVVVTENNPESILNALLEITSRYNFYLNKSIERVKSSELKKYEWGNLGDYFEKCLKEIKF